MIGHVMKGHLEKTVKSNAVAKIRVLAIRKPANAHAVLDGLAINVKRNAISDSLVIIARNNVIVILIIQ